MPFSKGLPGRMLAGSLGRMEAAIRAARDVPDFSSGSCGRIRLRSSLKTRSRVKGAPKFRRPCRHAFTVPLSVRVFRLFRAFPAGVPKAHEDPFASAARPVVAAPWPEAGIRFRGLTAWNLPETVFGSGKRMAAASLQERHMSAAMEPLFSRLILPGSSRNGPRAVCGMP